MNVRTEPSETRTLVGLLLPAFEPLLTGDPLAKTLVKRAIAAYVERMFESGNFSGSGR